MTESIYPYMKAFKIRFSIFISWNWLSTWEILIPSIINFSENIYTCPHRNLKYYQCHIKIFLNKIHLKHYSFSMVPELLFKLINVLNCNTFHKKHLQQTEKTFIKRCMILNINWISVIQDRLYRIENLLKFPLRI